MKILAVVGDWDDNGGRKSGYMAKALACLPPDSKVLNGGHYNDLAKHIPIGSPQYDLILWFANIPNDKPKLVGLIKENNPKSILVISKSNVDDKYGPLVLVARALSAKANLLLEFRKVDSKYVTTLWDPLGNTFATCDNPEDTMRAILDRSRYLSKMVRSKSIRVGDAKEVPDKPEFFDIVTSHSERFHKIIHAVNQDRFVGNLSFRCENGFPSFRFKHLIYVSKRNIDKRSINKDSFVAVNNTFTNAVEYYGDHKPSVDAPVQLMLYEAYPVLYMMHSHVYIKDAPFTAHPIPCGAIDEFYEILKVFPRKSGEVIINLRGHGSLICTSNLKTFAKIEYIPRQLPEVFDVNTQNNPRVTNTTLHCEQLVL